MENINSSSKKSNNKLVNLLFGGDVCLDTKGRQLPRNLRQTINEHDCFIFNCETVISRSERFVAKRRPLIINPEEVRFFENISCTCIASVANNHINDGEAEGILDTLAFL